MKHEKKKKFYFLWFVFFLGLLYGVTIFIVYQNVSSKTRFILTGKVIKNRLAQGFYNFSKKSPSYVIQFYAFSKGDEIFIDDKEHLIDESIPKLFRKSLKSTFNDNYEYESLMTYYNTKYSKENILSFCCLMHKDFIKNCWIPLKHKIYEIVKKNINCIETSGPLYLSINKIFTENGEEIPSHFFKIIFIGDKNDDYIAWIIPNKNIGNVNFDDYKVSLNEIQKKAGLEFSQKKFVNTNKLNDIVQPPLM